MVLYLEGNTDFIKKLFFVIFSNTNAEAGDKTILEKLGAFEKKTKTSRKAEIITIA